MKKVIKLILFCLCVLFISCTNQSKLKLQFFNGYMEWKQSDWINASSSFLNLSEFAQTNKNMELMIYSNFALGTTYIMQNEDNSALEKFSSLENTTQDKQLISSLFYQYGIIAFKKNMYNESAEYFKKSLKAESNNLDAKINYELSKKYLKNIDSKKEKSEIKPTTQQIQNDIFDNAIMELIKRKEEENWNKQQAQDKKQSAYDY